MIGLATSGVTWIKVDPPHLDVAGLILGSLGLAAAFALVALALGAALGLAFIRKHRASSVRDLSLHLDPTPRF